ncbi:hypothetical protein WA026_002740 [Henosepilachna vigintioctopunctata]|uniref:Uncharacterized protein n=1 Tax=Henosepilachna vigintioctopunctata TaxID=420089 RepID=A0AAW1U0C5_9CUCU
MSNHEPMLYFIILGELSEDGEEVFIPKRKKRKLWSKEWYLRLEFSHSNLLSELHVSAPAEFENFLRMDSVTYDDLLDKVRPFIEKKYTIMRSAISANEQQH